MFPVFSNLLNQLSDKTQQDQFAQAMVSHDKMMDAAISKVERGEMLVSEGKTMLSLGKNMMKEAHLQLISEVKRIIGCSVDHVVSHN